MLRKIGVGGIMGLKLAGMFGKGSVKVLQNYVIIL
jgi:hypothetical protein